MKFAICELPVDGAVRSVCHARRVKLGLVYADVAGMTPEDFSGMEERMDAIRLKQILGGPLSEQELMCLQIEQNGFGCHACPAEPPTLEGGEPSG